MFDRSELGIINPVIGCLNRDLLFWSLCFWDEKKESHETKVICPGLWARSKSEWKCSSPDSWGEISWKTCLRQLMIRINVGRVFSCLFYFWQNVVSTLHPLSMILFWFVRVGIWLPAGRKNSQGDSFNLPIYGTTVLNNYHFIQSLIWSLKWWWW